MGTVLGGPEASNFDPNEFTIMHNIVELNWLGVPNLRILGSSADQPLWVHYGWLSFVESVPHDVRSDRIGGRATGMQEDRRGVSQLDVRNFRIRGCALPLCGDRRKAGCGCQDLTNAFLMGLCFDGVVYGDGKSATPPCLARGCGAGGGLAGEGERELQRTYFPALERKTKGMQDHWETCRRLTFTRRSTWPCRLPWEAKMEIAKYERAPAELHVSSPAVGIPAL